MAKATGKILVMDDEVAVRDILARMLRYHGNSVDEAGDGEKAVALYSAALESGEPYDAVILDLNVPDGLGGKETMRKLLLIDPDVKGIVASGYTKDPAIVKYPDYGFRGAITKPFHFHKLLEVVGDVLNRTNI